MVYKEFSDTYGMTFDAGVPAAQSGVLDALVALEPIGSRRNYGRDAQIYAEGDAADCWFRVVAGTVRLTKLLADGRRHISEFCFAGDCFGLNDRDVRLLAAEAVGDAIVIRFSHTATSRLLETDSSLARRLWAMMLQDLTHAQTRTLLLGRMTAAERVASFLLEMAERRDAPRVIELPMSRNDIADYLGLTIETVCRVISGFKRERIIAVSAPHRIELRDREALAALSDA